MPLSYLENHGHLLYNYVANMHVYPYPQRETVYLRPLLFLPTGTGRRPCLPRTYTKGKHDFPDVIIAVVPGSLPVSPG